LEKKLLQRSPDLLICWQLTRERLKAMMTDRFPPRQTTPHTMKFKIPFTYNVEAIIEIDAANIEHAKQKFNNMSKFDGENKKFTILDRAEDLTPILSSFAIDEEKIEELNPTRQYNVKIARTQYFTVSVEAMDENDAEDKAREALDDVSDFDVEDEDIEAQEVTEVGYN
jgi:hypothetical protein